MYSKDLEDSDLNKARQSLIEETEAISWYERRISETRDKELKKILEHNRDEEKEHLAMIIEWLRKHDKELDLKFKEHD